MKLQYSILAASLLLTSSNAFQSNISQRKQQLSTSTTTTGKWQSAESSKRQKHGDSKNFLEDWKVAGASLVAAATISMGAATAIPEPATALELSRGAFVVETTASGKTLEATSIDTQSLAKTLFLNRKPLADSLQRIKAAVETELTTQPVWKELGKEVLDIEGDVVPSVKFSPPSDITQTLKDLKNGKLNFLLNGEVINVKVEPSFGAEEDDLIIKVSGFKGENLSPALPETNEPRMGPIRSQLAKLTGFWDFWNAPAEYLPGTTMATNGDVVVTGSVGTVAAVYIGSYSYYVSEQERVAAEAEAKKQKLAAKAAEKKRQEAAKKAKEESKVKEVKKEEEATSPDAEEADQSNGKKKSSRLKFWRKD